MILVSGGSGLVGAHLLLQLCELGERPRALYRSLESLSNVKQLFSSHSNSGNQYFKQIEWVKGDLLDVPSLEEAFKGVSQVYHCAALISFNPRDYHSLYKTNVIGTANMVNAALFFGASKFCYISSIASLGKETPGKEITEETSWNIDQPNVYAQSKYLAELEVWRAAQEGLPTVIINPGVILGPGIWQQGSGKLFAFAKKGKSFYFPGGSGFVAVKDVTKLMHLAMKSPLKNERFICVAENISYQKLFKYMAQGFGHKEAQYSLPFWLLAVLWRLDFLKYSLLGGGRKITKQTVEGLRQRDYYNHDKSKKQLEMTYNNIASVVAGLVGTYK